MQKIKDQLIDLQLQNTEHPPKMKNDVSKSQEEFRDFIGEDESIQNIKNNIKLFAKTPSPLFIYGETGTGKEVIVQNIHRASRTQGPLITQNCAAIPDNLLESFLFGTVKGGFTGAVDKEGLFEFANGGILFLDEINSLSMNLQAKLLRVLQDQKVRRVGGTKEIPVSVKIISATNIHPIELLENKEMREDLFYRLNVLYLELPPLRSRKEDIPLLIEHFISEYNVKLKKSIKGITEEALAYLMDHSWPGNIRELKNMIERLMNLVQSDYIGKSDIEFSDYLHVISPNYAQGDFFRKKNTKVNFKEEIQRIERKMIMDSLYETKGNISQAARNLDLPQQSLSNKIKKYNLEPEIIRIKLLKYE
ncbi:arginine utilization regulatory protein [Cytobacillus purgationiresistens]|uniref:Arginine utilization regulatory protein n=1 Tax=Cytobacillus purgationiresistens TaxID=863449 RepID=A0ABU0AEB5_9BACI|nr:arginine utilization regulatory protein [Cytobacillus purgationiresistens]